jgi:hypothetical protein
MTDHPNHIEPVCLSGLGCTVDSGPGGDRELGDFFKVALDKDGRALVSFADGDNQLGAEVAGGPAAAPSFADFVRQSTGPSLYASKGSLKPVEKPSQCIRVGAHHNPVPVSVPGTGAAGADNPALQLRGSCVTRLPNGDLQVTIQVADLDPVAATTPPAEPTATYLARWVYKHRVYFAAAEVNGGQWRYFSGEAAPVSDAAAIKYAYYPAAGSATGTTIAQNKTIVIRVPKDQVGSPGAGAALSTVTAYALTHTSPTLPAPPTVANFTDFPQVADSLPSYSARLDGKTRAATVAPVGFGGVGGIAPRDLLPGAALLLVLAAIGCAGRALQLRTAPRRLVVAG